jgi:hypothetical protein
MKRLIQFAVLLVPLAGCAHLPIGGTTVRDRVALWDAAHAALAAEDFARATANFRHLADWHPETLEGRESLFYLGAIHIDPRNPNWSTGPAEDRLGSYLALSEDEGAPRLYRYPEARILHEIARQLNLPAESRVAALQPEERVVEVEHRVVAPAEESRELAGEVERLRQQVTERDARIRQQQEELERIRRTLTTPPRP